MRFTKSAAILLILSFYCCCKRGKSSNYLCKDSHHSCRSKALYIPSVSKIPCLFCPYSCGLCMICPNNTHLWNKCCTSRNTMINSVESFLDTPTSKKYLAIIIELIDDRYIKTFLGIAIGTHHVITGKQGFRDPKNYSIYLNDNGINTPLKLTPIQFIQNLRYQKKLCIVAVKERIPNEYIIPLTTVLNPDGKIGHYLGMGNTYTYTFTKSYVEKFFYDLISSWKLYYFKDILKLILEFWQSCTGMGGTTSTERVTRGLVEAESEIIFKKVTTEFDDWQYLKVVFQKVCEIDEGSPLLISEGGRFVLQGLHMFCSCRRKKSYYFFFEIKGEIQCYGHFINIGEELQWINKIINKKIGFSSS